jgi:hypothetical protein
MKNTMRIIILVLLIMSTSGCAIVGFGSIGDAEYTSPQQNNPPYEIPNTDMTLSKRRWDKPFQLSDIETVWGKPAEIVVLNDTKRIIYNRGLRWRGIVIGVGIVVPVAVPVGHKTIAFNFENDTLINWTVHKQHNCMTYAGFTLIPAGLEGVFGFFADSNCYDK